MTEEEQIIVRSLLKCSLRARGFDRRTVKLCARKKDQEIKPSTHNYLIKMFHMYRCQIPQYQTLCSQLHLIPKP